MFSRNSLKPLAVAGDGGEASRVAAVKFRLAPKNSAVVLTYTLKLYFDSSFYEGSGLKR